MLGDASCFFSSHPSSIFFSSSKLIFSENYHFIGTPLFLSSTTTTMNPLSFYSGSFLSTCSCSLCVTCLCLSTCVLPPEITSFQKLLLKGMNDWCIGVCLSLSWLWHTINVGLRWYSIAQDPKLFIYSFLIFRRVQVSLPAPHTVGDFQGQQLAENSMKLQWLIYCNRWQEAELS